MDKHILDLLKKVAEIKSTKIEEDDYIRYECPFCKIGGHNHLNDCPISEARRIVEEYENEQLVLSKIQFNNLFEFDQFMVH